MCLYWFPYSLLLCFSSIKSFRVHWRMLFGKRRKTCKKQTNNEALSRLSLSNVAISRLWWRFSWLVSRGVPIVLLINPLMFKFSRCFFCVYEFVQFTRVEFSEDLFIVSESIWGVQWFEAIYATLVKIRTMNILVSSDNVKHRRSSF